MTSIDRYYPAFIHNSSIWYVVKENQDSFDLKKDPHRIFLISKDDRSYRYLYNPVSTCICVIDTDGVVLEEDLPTYDTRNFKLVAFSGRKHSGKSTAAEYIISKHPDESIQLSFGDPLKKACMELFGLTRDQVYHNKETVDPVWGVSPRMILQTVGTELIRNTLPPLQPTLNNVFVRRLEMGIHQAIIDGKKIIVVDDLRFSDEYELIRQYGGTVVEMDRPYPYQEDLHSSEHQTMLHEMLHDHIIINTGTLANLYVLVDELLKL